MSEVFGAYSAGSEATESRPELRYRTVELTTHEELMLAAELDAEIFSKVRAQYEGEAVAQPAVDSSEYERLVARGGHVIGFFADDSDVLIGGCGVALNNDPQAKEALLQTMEPDTAYMTVAAVREEYQGRGLGRTMLDMRLEIARQAGKTKAI